MEKIRYKYRKAKEGMRLDQIRCPICKNRDINWLKVVEDMAWRGRVVLLTECWSGDTSIDNPKHLFLIELEDLPRVEIKKMSNRWRK